MEWENMFSGCLIVDAIGSLKCFVEVCDACFQAASVGLQQ